MANYKGIHLMGKENLQQPLNEEIDKYQCPETGAHFEFLDMVRRLKKLQSRRAVIDKAIEDEERKKQALK